MGIGSTTNHGIQQANKEKGHKKVTTCVPGEIGEGMHNYSDGDEIKEPKAREA